MNNPNILTLNLNLDNKSYPIYIGENLLSQAQLLTDHIKGKQIMIVSNTKVAPLYLQNVKNLLSDYEVCDVILADGEEFKTIETTNLIWSELLEKKFDRSCTLIALGGGVVGDITGFAASSYQRGVDFIQIPTTLLSQVDSSVGGKTGVNHALAKNMIGAFYQPKCVVIDINTLQTLDNRQFSSGMSEVIKYGLLEDLDFYNFIKNNITQIMQFDSKLLIQIIYKACKAKADIVEEDELEKGIRALLNLGHTFGHAIENLLGYGVYLHGEAVAVGIIMAARMSELEGFIDKNDVKNITNIMQKCNLPITINGKIKKGEFLQTMRIDKKAISGIIRLVLFNKIGKAYIADDYEIENLKQVISEFCK